MLLWPLLSLNSGNVSVTILLCTPLKTLLHAAIFFKFNIPALEPNPIHAQVKWLFICLLSLFSWACASSFLYTVPHLVLALPNTIPAAGAQGEGVCLGGTLKAISIWFLPPWKTLPRIVTRITAVSLYLVCQEHYSWSFYILSPVFPPNNCERQTTEMVQRR